MDWIETTATIVQAVAITAAGIAAWRGLTTWRHEMTARRRAELAEHTLALFYKARDTISLARFPGSHAEEGLSRETQPDETRDQTSYRNAVYVPVERLLRQSEFWGQFEAARYPFIAVFGKKSAAHFQAVREVKSLVIVSAGMLIRTYSPANEEREDRLHQRKEWERNIGWDFTGEDELASRIDRAVSAIEEICRPAITGATR